MADSYHHGTLRMALVEAAIRAVERHGVDGVKVSALARELGVSSAAPFRHFDGRQELLVAAAEHAAREMGEAVEGAAAAVSDPLEAQRARGVAYVRFAVEHPGHFRLLTRADLWQASDLLRQMHTSSLAMMEPVLGGGRVGDFGPDVVRRSAGVLAAQSLTVGLATLIVEGLLGEVSPDQAERLADDVLGVLGQDHHRGQEVIRDSSEETLS